MKHLILPKIFFREGKLKLVPDCSWFLLMGKHGLSPIPEYLIIFYSFYLIDFLTSEMIVEFLQLHDPGLPKVKNALYVFFNSFSKI